MIIKVCGLNNGDNINQLMKLDLDFMGIIFYEKSSRFFSSGVLPKSEKKYVAVFVDESLDVIEEGVVDDPDMLDFAMIMGTGWAPFRGGPINYIDSRKLTV